MAYGPVNRLGLSFPHIGSYGSDRPNELVQGLVHDGLDGIERRTGAELDRATTAGRRNGTPQTMPSRKEAKWAWGSVRSRGGSSW